MKQIIAFIITVIGCVAVKFNPEIGFSLEWIIATLLSSLVLGPAFLWWVDRIKKINRQK